LGLQKIDIQVAPPETPESEVLLEVCRDSIPI
jgi:hypothetical protein